MRGAKPLSYNFSSPSPRVERGIQGVRLMLINKFEEKDND
jgi:hypothetical protein